MITKCNNGHWYDTTVHKSCPHCKQESEKLSIRLEDVEEDDHTISIMEADMSLGEELGDIIGVAAGNMGNAPSGMGDPLAEDDDKTVSFGFFGFSSIQQPVTGWMVCIDGEECGKDFRLHTGKNFLGRSTSMDLVLLEDKKVARERHCSITYDPKGNAFFVSPEGGNTVYVNDTIIDVPMPLQEGDEVTVGTTKMVFIPYCKEGRTWENN